MIFEKMMFSLMEPYVFFVRYNVGNIYFYLEKLLNVMLGHTFTPAQRKIIIVNLSRLCKQDQYYDLSELSAIIKSFLLIDAAQEIPPSTRQDFVFSFLRSNKIDIWAQSSMRLDDIFSYFSKLGFSVVDLKNEVQDAVNKIVSGNDIQIESIDFDKEIQQLKIRDFDN